MHLRFEARRAGGLKEGVLEIFVTPHAECAATTSVTLRTTWKVGLWARLFADEILLSVPALATLGLRDDLVARFLADLDGVRGELEQRLSGFEMIQIRADGQPAAQPLTRLRFEPTSVRVAPASSERLRVFDAGGRYRAAERFAACMSALSSMTRIVDYSASIPIEGGGTWRSRLKKPGPDEVSYDLQVMAEGLSFVCEPGR